MTSNLAEISMITIFLLGNQSSDSSNKSEPVPRKKSPKESLLDPNRSQNVAIAKKKLPMSCSELSVAITK